MKFGRGFLLLVAIFISTPTTFSQTIDISGTWSMVCCDGKHRGEIEIVQTRGTITGRFRDLQGNDTGSLSGVVQGNKVTFTRIFDGRKRQTYSLTLGSGGQSMTGVLAGDRDRSVGVDVTCTRKNRQTTGNRRKNRVEIFLDEIATPGNFTKKVLGSRGELPISVRQMLSEDSRNHFRQYPTSAKGHHYISLNSLGRSNLSPEQIMALIMKNPDQVFPIFDARGRGGQAITMGRKYDLTYKLGRGTAIVNPVEVTAMSPYSFTFKTLEGHQLQGSATHGVFKDSTGELWLFQEGIGVRGESRSTQSFTYSVAEPMWSRMANLVKSLISSAPSPSPKYRL